MGKRMTIRGEREKQETIMMPFSLLFPSLVAVK